MKPPSIVLGVALLTVCSLSSGQVPPPIGATQDYEAMAKAMEKAQADAIQPGDERLTCDQLQQQLVAVGQDPAFQAYVQAAGVAAQKDLAMQVPKGEIAAQTAATIAASMVPGAAMGQMTASAAQNQAKAAQTTARVQSRMMDAQQMMVFMPKLMRGQRLIELAAIRKCEWIAGLGVPQP